MTTTTKPAETFAIFGSLTTARRVCARIRDQNIIAGVRGRAPNCEVYGYVPKGRTLVEMQALAERVRAEK